MCVCVCIGLFHVLFRSDRLLKYISVLHAHVTLSQQTNGPRIAFRNKLNVHTFQILDVIQVHGKMMVWGGRPKKSVEKLACHGLTHTRRTLFRFVHSII